MIRRLLILVLLLLTPLTAHARGYAGGYRGFGFRGGGYGYHGYAGYRSGYQGLYGYGCCGYPVFDPLPDGAGTGGAIEGQVLCQEPLPGQTPAQYAAMYDPASVVPPAPGVPPGYVCIWFRPAR